LASSAGSPIAGRVLGDGRAACPAVAEPDERRRAAVARLPPRIGFVGFGLIGGSVALALREAGYAGTMVAWTPDGNGPTEGRRSGFLDEVSSSSTAAIEGAGLIVLAGPPLAVVSWVGEPALASAARAGATVTDVASTKGVVVGRAESAGLPFVGGHPMAGRETSGVAGAAADLFVDRPWLIVPAATARETDVDRVAALAGAVGARPMRMTAQEHDQAVAAISHLPLVAAAALIESVTGSDAAADDWPVARALAATGWADMTRLARGDPEMGAGILDTNREAVAARLRAYRGAIDRWIGALEAGVAVDALRTRLEAARDALEGPPR
jgi:prephenate dehydrogenase